MSVKDYETRLYVKDNLSIGKSLVLKNDQSHHIRSVLRLKKNSQIALSMVRRVNGCRRLKSFQRNCGIGSNRAN